MFRITTGLAVVAGLALGGAAPADTVFEFTKFTSPAGRFSVELPGKPKEETQKNSDGSPQYIFSVSKLPVAEYRIYYSDFEPKVVQGKDPGVLLKAFRDGASKGAKIDSEKELTLGDAKVPALDYRFARDKLFVRERAVLAGTRLYMLEITALGKDFLGSEDANRFFDSFAVTGQAPAAAPGQPAAAPTGPEIAGAYDCVGDQGDGKQYQGKVRITKEGDTYAVTWTFGTTQYTGLGIRDGDTLAVAIRSPTNPMYTGLVVYRIDKARKMAGRWSAVGYQGKVLTETLTPAK